MKRKTKIILDIVMLLMSVTFFNKNLFGLQYHEIAGLILLLIMIIHIALNLKIIKNMCKKFIKIPIEIKAGLITDILLIICFAWIGLSGIMISHTILTGISSNNMIFKIGHMFAGGASIILLGIHIGLHIYKNRLNKIAAAIITIVILFGGIYGFSNSSAIRWLSMPYDILTQTGENTELQNNDKSRTFDRKKIEDSTQSYESDNIHKNTPPSDISSNFRKNTTSLSFFQKIQNIVMFLCMILFCTIITYWIILLKKQSIKNHITK